MVSMKVLVPTLILLVVFLAGCSETPERLSSEPVQGPARSNVASPHFSDSDALIREKGKAVVQEAFSILSSNLMTALTAGGPSNAIPIRSVKAFPLTQSVSEDYQVALRRVSHRWRNPVNAPSDEEREVLNEFQSQVAAGRTPVPVVKRSGGKAFFYSPIILNNPLCLTCHGEIGNEVAPETSVLLARLYPDDRATGFHLDDLRGMWVVEIPQNAKAP